MRPVTSRTRGRHESELFKGRGDRTWCQIGCGQVRKSSVLSDIKVFCNLLGFSPERMYMKSSKFKEK